MLENAGVIEKLSQLTRRSIYSLKHLVGILAHWVFGIDVLLLKYFL